MANKFIILPNGARMPVVGLGTWMNQDPLVLKKSMEAALNNGYRHFDTAYIYFNEQVIGKVFEQWFTRGIVKRDELFVTTKLPMNGVHPDRVEYFLDKSLKNLNLEYVDLYLIHFPVSVKFSETNPFPVNEAGEIETEPTDLIAVWKKMEEMVEYGKVRAIGLSNFTIPQITKILRICTIKPINVQVEVNVYFQNAELVEFCRKNGISVVAYSPLGCPGLNPTKEKGFLFDKVPDLLNDETVVSIAKKHSKTSAQIMLRFLVQNGLVVIPKSSNPERIKENIEIFDFKLDDEDMDKLKKLDKGPAGRIIDIAGFDGLPQHPEYPFKK